MQYRIRLHEGWYKIIDPEEFNNWIDSSGIQEHDWNFISTSFSRQVIMFAHEKDAVAFRLRYGL